MAVAMVYPEPQKGGRGKQTKNSKLNLGFSPMLLSQARAVVPYPDLSKAVLDGSMSLRDAKAEAEPALKNKP
jgi:hypothetical protein